MLTGQNSKLSRNAVGRPPDRVDVQCQVTKRRAHLLSSFTPQKQNCKGALKTSARQVWHVLRLRVTNKPVCVNYALKFQLISFLNDTETVTVMTVCQILCLALWSRCFSIQPDHCFRRKISASSSNIGTHWSSVSCCQEKWSKGLNSAFINTSKWLNTLYSDEKSAETEFYLFNTANIYGHMSWSHFAYWF